MPDNMTQLVRAEICTATECSGLCSVPRGYTSKCEQKYIQKRLVALQASGQNLYTDVFWIPSCCQCTITPTNL
ncbi:Spatzle 5 [Operophtera brumata]|uniref:Spatzle 5 n=2 Tax=Operophtera brumata TaxID=104452 RepID=A0A0L7LB00_OPEBR|nr:Spatzle 5 [Operophtera brumata]